MRTLTMLTPAPWYHYIPLKPDYSDLYDIMAFFVGPVDEYGNVDETKGHDVSVSSLRYYPYPTWSDESILVVRLVKRVNNSLSNNGRGRLCRHT